MIETMPQAVAFLGVCTFEIAVVVVSAWVFTRKRDD